MKKPLAYETWAHNFKLFWPCRNCDTAARSVCHFYIKKMRQIKARNNFMKG